MPENITATSNATPLPLVTNEQVLFLTRPSFIITFFFILALWLSGAALLYVIVSTHVLNSITFINHNVLIIIYIAAFLFVALIIYLSWLNTEYILTNRRVELRFGIISSGTVSIALENIQSVSVSVGVIGFILNFGTIRIEPAGLITPINFRGIPHPKLYAEQIESAKL